VDCTTSLLRGGVLWPILRLLVCVGGIKRAIGTWRWSIEAASRRYFPRRDAPALASGSRK
jgi:hypothetical protein